MTRLQSGRSRLRARQASLQGYFVARHIPLSLSSSHFVTHKLRFKSMFIFPCDRRSRYDGGGDESDISLSEEGVLGNRPDAGVRRGAELERVLKELDGRFR
jgi:hypothetical protein